MWRAIDEQPVPYWPVELDELPAPEWRLPLADWDPPVAPARPREASRRRPRDGRP
jgi:hypothetical protein